MYEVAIIHSTQYIIYAFVDFFVFPRDYGEEDEGYKMKEVTVFTQRNWMPTELKCALSHQRQWALPFICL